MANETILRNGYKSLNDASVEGTLKVEELAVVNTSGSTQYSLPTSVGTTGYALTANGSGALQWTALPSIAGLLTDISNQSIFTLNDVAETDQSMGTGEILQFNGTNFVGIDPGTLQTDLTGYALESYVDNSISARIDAAPGALDTLNELAASLGDDADFAGTMTTALAGKAPLVHTHTHDDITDFDVEVTALANTAIASTNLGALNDVNVGGAANQQVLSWDGNNSEWIAVNVSALSQADSVSSLTDTQIGTDGAPALATGQVIYYTGSAWQNVEPEDAGIITTDSNIEDLSNVDSVGVSGQILVSNGTTLIATDYTDWQEYAGTIGSDSATTLFSTTNTDGYNAVTVHYSIRNATGAMRTGTLMVITDGSTTEMTDISTNSIGTENLEPNFTGVPNGGNLDIRIVNGNGYTVKATYRQVNG
jgi:hypothetical protein